LKFKIGSYMSVSLKVGPKNLGNSTYFWEFNKGRWVAQSLIKPDEIQGGYYRFSANTTGTKNIGKVIDTSDFSGRVVRGSTGSAHSQVIIYGDNYSSYHVAYCD
jgi:hypothetical protein